LYLAAAAAVAVDLLEAIPITLQVAEAAEVPQEDSLLS
jgi:hypothetical protein